MVGRASRQGTLDTFRVTVLLKAPMMRVQMALAS
jgi:hypothetical protein